ncbi:MAG: indolepyruvate ferredoxin oxidoreductase subunit beta [Fervidicoccus sp.]|nr:MAG: indolepyruvate ferredoxin oxidoreductase subunit beta [Fervidicoccus sp.]
MMEYNIIIAGIGGQGVLTIARIIGEAALEEGIKVRIGEIHGLSQRFGSLFSHVRLGDEVYGGLIPMGRGDLLIALEPAESLRHLHYMKKGSTLLLSTNPIEPPQVSMGLFNYPPLEKIRELALKEFGLKIIELDSRKMAEEVGSIIAQNSIMLGAALALESFPLKYESVVSAVRRIISRRFADMNMKALEVGMREAKKKLGIF